MLIKPSINVLIVEDDITTLQKCRELLLNEGNRVRTAESVQEALSIIQKQPGDVDIMLISLELSGWGGLTLINVLQKARGEILVMAMSTECGDQAIEAIQAGAYDCIRKDFTADWFWTKMNRATEAFRLRRQLGVLTREKQTALARVQRDGETLRCVLNSFTYGLVVADWQTNIVLVNNKAISLFDLNEEEVLGRPVSESIRSDELLSFFMRALKSDSSLAKLMAGEEPIVKTGDKTFRVHVDPVRNQAGVVIGAVGLFHDVTNIDAMDQLRADFLSMVSHELKAPLSSLLMQISVILDGLAGEITPKQTDLLSKAKEKTKGMITLVNDILDYRRIQEGKSVQKIESLELAEILQRTIEIMRLSSEEKGITLKCEIERELPPFRGDRGGIEAVFVNLISNAIKYTPKGGNVDVGLNRGSKEIQFKVADTGIGISPQDIDRIFERFYRIKTEQTRSISGSGLGLAIVKGILDTHGGSINVQSHAGKGTTFIVSLPMEE
jgi:PAS domain S-box-containing protein